MTARLRLLVIDSEEHTAAALRSRITERGHDAAHALPDAPSITAAIGNARFDAAILDFHNDRPDELASLERLRAQAPGLPLLVLVSPGLALQRVRAWQAKHDSPDEIIRKPLDGDALFRTLASVVARRRSDERASRYASLVAEEGRPFAESPEGKPELSEQAVVFTDIRRSTELISTLPLPEWFAAINTSLSDQGAIVRNSGGSVVKYTGDGLLATFRGRGRAARALNCAIALQALDRSPSYRGALRIGIGLAEGLVMRGLIGEPGRQQYDVIGATVHLASRLCASAAEGEIYTTPRLVRAAGMTGAMPPVARSLQLRGFALPVECVSFSQLRDHSLPQSPPEP